MKAHLCFWYCVHSRRITTFPVFSKRPQDGSITPWTQVFSFMLKTIRGRYVLFLVGLHLWTKQALLNRAFDFREKADCCVFLGRHEQTSYPRWAPPTNQTDFTEVQVGEFIGLSYRAYVRHYLQECRWPSNKYIFIMDGDLMEVASWCPAFNRPFISVYSLSPPKIIFRWGRNSWNPRQGSHDPL